MPEAITKYAVNSTLGTENFKPLNMLLIDEYRKGFRYIPNPEGDRLASMQGSYSNTEDSRRYSLIFNPQISGRILVKYYSTNDLRRVRLDIYEGNELIFNDNQISEDEKQKEIEIKENKEYTFTFYNTNNIGRNVNIYLDLYGTVIIGGFFEAYKKTEIL
jgi:hypothetical protein